MRVDGVDWEWRGMAWDGVRGDRGAFLLQFKVHLQVMRLGSRGDESVYIDITRYFFMTTTY